MRASAYAGLFLALILFCCPVHAKVLFGEVGHSDTVAPVEKDLQPGATFSRDKIPAKGALIVVTWPKVKNGLGFPARAFAILP